MTARPASRLRGEFTATLGGETLAFDTSLATVALIEDRCGGVSIVEAINKAVFGRRAADQMALIAGALGAMGHAHAEAHAARCAAVEAEAFVLALMEALGFEVVRKPEGSAAGPFEEAPTSTGKPPGAAGEVSRSVD